jgi:hypothetical protein
VHHFDGDVLDVLLEDGERGVAGQFQPVEAGVALGVGVDRVVFHHLYVELLELAAVAFQVLKAHDRHTPVSSHEIQH